MLKTKIKEYREKENMKQSELAALIGVRRETIVHLENGRYNPSLKMAMDIARVFHTTVEELFEFTDWRVCGLLVTALRSSLLFYSFCRLLSRSPAWKHPGVFESPRPPVRNVSGKQPASRCEGPGGNVGHSHCGFYTFIKKLFIRHPYASRLLGRNGISVVLNTSISGKQAGRCEKRVS